MAEAAEYISILEAADLLGLSGGEFGCLVDGGTLRMERHGDHLVVDRAGVDALSTSPS